MPATAVMLTVPVPAVAVSVPLNWALISLARFVAVLLSVPEVSKFGNVLLPAAPPESEVAPFAQLKSFTLSDTVMLFPPVPPANALTFTLAPVALALTPIVEGQAEMAVAKFDALVDAEVEVVKPPAVELVQ
jgi:hypothetical protein